MVPNWDMAGGKERQDVGGDGCCGTQSPYHDHGEDDAEGGATAVNADRTETRMTTVLPNIAMIGRGMILVSLITPSVTRLRTRAESIVIAPSVVRKRD
jgi:hypothetical protein